MSSITFGYQPTNFSSKDEAIEAAILHLKEEEPGSYYELKSMRDGQYFNVALYEQDGYLIGEI